MDDRDLYQMRKRLVAIRLAVIEADRLASYRAAGVVELDGFSLPLTAGQQTALRTRALNLLTEAESTAASLESLTGKTGEVIEGVLSEVVLNPLAIFPQMATRVARVSLLLNDLRPDRQPDGSYLLTFSDELVQSLADESVTFRDGLGHVVPIIRDSLA